MRLAGKSFGLVGGLAAFPRRIAARETARQGGTLRRGLGRGTHRIVLGRTLLNRDDAQLLALHAGALAAGHVLLSENGFLAALGLRDAPERAGLGTEAMLRQSGLTEADLALLAVFDAFEAWAEPFTFRDAILARKYAGLLAAGATIPAILRAIHQRGPSTSLTALALEVGDRGAILSRHEAGLAELDGQALLPLDNADLDADALFARAELAEAEHDHALAAGLYRLCLEQDRSDAVAAFNLGNCLRAVGEDDEAVTGFMQAISLDPGFVEAWFNLAALLESQGKRQAARHHLERALALDPGFADAVFNLARLNFDDADFDAARALWSRYLELDGQSEWAAKARRGIRFIDLHHARHTA